jgi:hypothetical protein
MCTNYAPARGARRSREGRDMLAGVISFLGGLIIFVIVIVALIVGLIVRAVRGRKTDPPPA